MHVYRGGHYLEDIWYYHDSSPLPPLPPLQLKVMCSKVESEVHAFSIELEKFAARWHQLKPKDQLLDGDSEACSGALSVLKERRAEFDELMATASRLRWATEFA